MAYKFMIDVAMTASIRPDVIIRTLESIGTNITYRPLRLIVDISHVGEVHKYSQDYCIEVIKNCCTQYGIDLVYRKLPLSLQAEALKWTWSKADTDFVLQWEDDWVLLQKIDITVLMQLMNKHQFGMLYFDRYKKSVVDYPGYKGVFNKLTNNTYVRIKGKSLGGPPALLKKEYIKAVLPLIKDEVCLDTISPTKEVQEVLKNWSIGVYYHTKGNLVKDIGKEWKERNNLIMRKNTKVGVQWIKKN